MYHKILQLTLLQLFSVVVSRDNVKSTGFKTFYDNNLSATSSIIYILPERRDKRYLFQARILNLLPGGDFQ